MILITGATGFLGSELIKRLYGTEDIRVVSRNEGKLLELESQYPGIEFVTGDIADMTTCEIALKGIDTVYHLSAFKHVGLAETQAYQCTQSNVTGTINLLRLFKGKSFIAISTDKASQISGVYGATKYIMEKLIEEFQSFRPETQYRVIRYGNVLYSTGSVLCKWKKLMQEGKVVTVTAPEATRFFWTLEQAVDHIFECLEVSTDATPYVPTMKAMSIGNLLKAMGEKYGISEIEEIGLQAGENLHETMDGVTFSNEVEQYTIGEILRLI